MGQVNIVLSLRGAQVTLVDSSEWVETIFMREKMYRNWLRRSIRCWLSKHTWCPLSESKSSWRPSRASIRRCLKHHNHCNDHIIPVSICLTCALELVNIPVDSIGDSCLLENLLQFVPTELSQEIQGYVPFIGIYQHWHQILGHHHHHRHHHHCGHAKYFVTKL